MNGAPPLNPSRPDASATTAASARNAEVERLYEEALPRLRRHLVLLLGSARHVDDLAQETIVAAWRAWDRFDGRSTRTTWLLGIATFVARNHRAKHRRRTSIFERWSRAGADAPPPAAPAALGAEVRELYLALDALDDRDREAFLLVHVDGHTTREAAEILGVPSSTVHVRAARAARRIRGPEGEQG